jgi:hypothetical protein
MCADDLPIYLREQQLPDFRVTAMRRVPPFDALLPADPEPRLDAAARRSIAWTAIVGRLQGGRTQMRAVSLSGQVTDVGPRYLPAPVTDETVVWGAC